MLKVHGCCRLSHDLEVKKVGDVSVCSFQVVWNESKKKAKSNPNDADEYDSIGHFFNCVIWDTGADRFAKTVSKGDMFTIIDGDLKEEKWETDGVKKSRTVIRINRFVPHARKDS